MKTGRKGISVRTSEQFRFVAITEIFDGNQALCTFFYKQYSNYLFVTNLIFTLTGFLQVVFYLVTTELKNITYM